jgi:xylitol oxidase
MRHNWSSNVNFQEQEYLEPTNLDDLQDIVASQKFVRARGSAHSFNSIADSNNTIVSLEKMPQTIEIDEVKQNVKVSSFLKYGELVPTLHARGWALSNLASLPHISIAGSVSTATHGSGIFNKNLAAQVAAVEFIDSTGSIRHLSEGSREYEAFVVGLGLTGIITNYWLKIEPSFNVKQIIYENVSDIELEKSFDEIMGTAYSVSFFTRWDSSNQGNLWCKFKENQYIPDIVSGAHQATKKLHPIPEVDPVAATEQFGVTGPWLERLAHFKLDFTPSVGDEIQSEFFVDRENAPAVIQKLRELSPKFRDMLWISELRTIAADNFWMSTASARDSVGFHFTWKKSNFDPKVVKEIEENLVQFDYRPHWGKVFYAESRYLRSVYPKYSDFVEAVNLIDPNKKFSNQFTTLLFQ